MSEPDEYAQQYRTLQRRVGELRGAHEETTRSFAALHRAAMAEGALTRKTKELMALAISVAVHCDPCIAYHAHDAAEAGASREEAAEAIGVAVMMAGGTGLTYGAQALAAFDEFADARRGA